MKTNLLNYLFIVLFLTSMVACEEDDFGLVGGEQSSMGEVGNTFSFSFPGITGVSNGAATVTENEDGVSLITYSATVTNEKYLNMISSPDIQVDGSKITGEFKCRMSTDGIEVIDDDGNSSILVKYDASVGDTYSGKYNGSSITREVTDVSSEDDFLWGGWLLKVVQVEATNCVTPGVAKCIYYANHKFGLVAVRMVFEDGTSKQIYLFSKQNDYTED